MDKTNIIMISIIAFAIGFVVLALVIGFIKNASSSILASPSPASTFLNQQTPPPSPNPDELLFIDQKPTQPQATPQPAELPLEKVKKLSKFPGVLKPEDLQNKKAVIETSKGRIELEIYPESPKAASNFLLLSANGFYNNLTFHRVEDWVLQGGDPTGNGTGGPGYKFEDEPVTKDYVRGIVAMANAGPDTNGSQFFILKKDYPLEPNYTIFGKVILGLEVVDKLMVGDMMQKVTIEPIK